MTLVVASGGIDLSMGIAIDFGGWFAIIGMRDYDLTWASALLLGVVAGAAVGLLNATLVVRLRVSPFLATLGTFFIGSSIQQIYTSGGGQVPFREMSESYRSLSHRSRAGGSHRDRHRLGGARAVLRDAGEVDPTASGSMQWACNPRLHRWPGSESTATWPSFSVFAAATVALGGIILTAGLRQFTPLSGFSYLLDSIAAVFIGASMHPRRRPNVPGTLVGVLFLGVVLERPQPDGP